MLFLWLARGSAPLGNPVQSNGRLGVSPSLPPKFDFTFYFVVAYALMSAPSPQLDKPAMPTRDYLVLIPTCQQCKRQESHAPDCDRTDFVNAVYRRTDTFLRFDYSKAAPDSTLKFSASLEPTNWQASPDGSQIEYSPSVQRRDGWNFLRLHVEFNPAPLVRAE